MSQIQKINNIDLYSIQDRTTEHLQSSWSHFMEILKLWTHQLTLQTNSQGKSDGTSKE